MPSSYWFTPWPHDGTENTIWPINLYYQKVDSNKVSIIFCFFFLIRKWRCTWFFKKGTSATKWGSWPTVGRLGLATFASERDEVIRLATAGLAEMPRKGDLSWCMHNWSHEGKISHVKFYAFADSSSTTLLPGRVFSISNHSVVFSCWLLRSRVALERGHLPVRNSCLALQTEERWMLTGV